MFVIGILLIVAGVLGFLGSSAAFGDIGLSFALTGIVSILAGIGFILCAKGKNSKNN